MGRKRRRGREIRSWRSRGRIMKIKRRGRRRLGRRRGEEEEEEAGEEEIMGLIVAIINPV